MRTATGFTCDIGGQWLIHMANRIDAKRPFSLYEPTVVKQNFMSDPVRWGHWVIMGHHQLAGNVCLAMGEGQHTATSEDDECDMAVHVDYACPVCTNQVHLDTLCVGLA